MRTVIRNQVPQWTVASAVPQELVLAPVMFSVYINNMMDGKKGYTRMCGDGPTVMS